ncbi:MAG: dockerin type I domain-containing protein [bacterium]
MAVSGNYAYVAEGKAGVWILDISDPAKPQAVGHFNTKRYTCDIAVSGHYVYVAECSAGLQVFDISKPTHPVLAGSLDTEGSTQALVISDNYIYAADGDALRIIDISDPTNPVGVGYIDTRVFAGDASVSGDYACVTDGSAGLPIIDISKPSHPEEVSVYMPEAEGFVNYVASSDSFAYVLFNPRSLKYSRLFVVDISVPEQAEEVSSLPLSGADVTISGDYLYILGGGTKVKIIDTSDPVRPTQMGSFSSKARSKAFHTLGHGAGEVTIREDKIYLTWGFNGLFILQNDLWEGEKGDVTGDETIDVADVIRTVNIILDFLPEPTPYELWAADYNGDGSINVLDIVQIINLILSGPGRL